MNLTLSNLAALSTLLALILAAGMWLGSLQRQVNDLAAKDTYYHGQFSPQEAK